jgi:hypothetical protein
LKSCKWVEGCHSWRFGADVNPVPTVVLHREAVRLPVRRLPCPRACHNSLLTPFDTWRPRCCMGSSCQRLTPAVFSCVPNFGLTPTCARKSRPCPRYRRRPDHVTFGRAGVVVVVPSDAPLCFICCGHQATCGPIVPCILTLMPHCSKCLAE